MKKISHIPEIDTIKNLLQQNDVRRAYLFGSYAKNTQTEDSDLDILVDLKKSADLFSFIRLKHDLENLTNRKIDLVSSKGISPRIKPIIDNEKILIYET